MLLIEAIVALVIILLSVRYYLTRNYDYWRRRGIAGPQPIAIFGTFKDVDLVKVHVADHTKAIYDSYPHEPAVGIFASTTPVLMIKDLHMIKDVLVKNFMTFPNRGSTIHQDIEPLMQNLLFFDYERWRPMRSKLAPTFTLAKLKQMFHLMNQCADHFADYLQDLVLKGQPIECRQLTSKFTIDVIAVCFFGLNTNILADEDSEFVKIGRRCFGNAWHNILRIHSRLLPRWINVILRPFIRDEEAIRFFVKLIKATMDYRKNETTRRHDFIELLMDIREHPEQVGYAEMSDVMVTAQAFAFFLAGYETSATTICSAMYELALNPLIQDKLRDEIKVTLQNGKGQFSCDSFKNMHYLDRVFKETLRKYSVAPILPREAVADHTFVHSNISVTKGTKIYIPVHAIHHDANYYPNPEQFDPERFNEEAINSRPAMTFLPFGVGPRSCIGEEFAHSQSKLGIATIIRHFRLEVCEKTCKRYIKEPGFLLLAPKGGLYLKITSI